MDIIASGVSRAIGAPILRDVAELERQARGTGVTAAMAKATLRMIGAGAAYGRKDGQKEVGGTEPPAPVPTRSTGSPLPTTIDRIDNLLAVYGGA